MCHLTPHHHYRGASSKGQACPPIPLASFVQTISPFQVLQIGFKRLGLTVEADSRIHHPSWESADLMYSSVKGKGVGGEPWQRGQMMIHTYAVRPRMTSLDSTAQDISHSDVEREEMKGGL